MASSPTPKAGKPDQCPACGAAAAGKFCSSCGATLAGATCASCDAPLAPGAKFCHRCGAPAQAGAVVSQERSFSSALPWGVAAIALVAFIALVAGQRFSRAPSDTTPAPIANNTGATGNGQASDISNLSPGEAAIRLYNRVMGQHERGRADSVQIFAPMAIAAYQMIGTLDLDQHYDVGRIAAITGDERMARAQADTILAKNPNHLLGLILAGEAARLRKNTAAEQTYHSKLVAAAPAERAKQLQEYLNHENDINAALGTKTP